MKPEIPPELQRKVTEGAVVRPESHKAYLDMKQTRSRIRSWAVENPQAINWLANFGLGFCANCVSIDAHTGRLSATGSRVTSATIHQEGERNHG